MLRLAKKPNFLNNLSCIRPFSAVNVQSSPETIQSNDERYEQMIDLRRSQAKRSIVVEIESKELSRNVYNYCKQFGDIHTAIQYVPRDGRNFVLLEYSHVDSLNEALKHIAFKPNAVQWQMQFLKLRTAKLQDFAGQTVDVPIELGYTRTPPDIVSILQNATCMNEQIQLLYKHTRITDISTRLRFLSTHQIERVLNQFLDKILPSSRILPFGSTTNGAGKLSSDLDIALRFQNVDKVKTEGNSLEFHGKEIGEESKILDGRRIKCIASVIKYCLPGAENVVSIHRAKVPIVGFFDKNIHCNVDLSIINPAGFYATNILYELGLMDPRAQPLISLVRRWAKEFNITKFKSNDNFTNFHLTFMTLSFLQKLEEPILPTLDKVPFENGAFIFDRERISFTTTNTCTVLELFHQFLEYYKTFDVNKYKISLLTRELIPKNNVSAVVIEDMYNPSESYGGNISSSEYETFKFLTSETLSELELYQKTKVDNQRWGILELLTHLK